MWQWSFESVPDISLPPCTYRTFVYRFKKIGAHNTSKNLSLNTLRYSTKSVPDYCLQSPSTISFKYFKNNLSLNTLRYSTKSVPDYCLQSPSTISIKILQIISPWKRYTICSWILPEISLTTPTTVSLFLQALCGEPLTVSPQIPAKICVLVEVTFKTKKMANCRL